MNWSDVWKLPLKLDDFGFYVWDANDKMALMFYENEEYDDDVDFAPIAQRIRSQMISQINGESYFAPFTGLRYEKGEFINNDGDNVLCVRGFGHLTGVGGLNLNDEEASRIQDEFGQYIIEKLHDSKTTETTL